MPVAFFDIDMTLISVNSATLWLRRELRLGYLDRWQALRGACWAALYGVGFVRVEKVIEDAVAAMSGDPEAELVARNLAFWEEEIRGRIRPGAVAAVQRHRGRGDVCYALTSSTNYLADLVTEELGLEGNLTNHLIVEEGLFTGGVRKPLCFGPGKVDHARRLLDAMQVPLADCTFYTDSFSDVPMLEAVGHPVVVHPDWRLRRYARARRWPIEDWSTPALERPQTS